MLKILRLLAALAFLAGPAAAQECTGLNCDPAPDDTLTCSGQDCAKTMGDPVLECSGANCLPPSENPVEACKGEGCTPQPLPETAPVPQQQ